MFRKVLLWGIFLLCLLQIYRNGGVKSNTIHSSVIAELQTVKHLIVVAHEDDDLLFMNPDLWNHINAGHVVETVYFTAGDCGKPKQYWLGREAGVKAAYAYMAKVANDWQEEQMNLANHRIVRFVLRHNPKIRLVFLRLPDGIDIRRWKVTLRISWQYDQVIIYSKDQCNFYRKGDLVQVLKALIDDLNPDEIAYLYPGDHVDHFYTAKFVELTEEECRNKHSMIRYRDYNINKSPPNLTVFDSHLKWQIAQIYAKYDERFPKKGFERTYRKYYNWCLRSYYYADQFMKAMQPQNPLDSMLDWTLSLD